MKIFFALLVFFNGPTSLANMKGWELYCINDKAVKSEVRYALLPGTNRLKSESEVVQTKRLASLSELLKKLSQLPKGTSILIMGGGLKKTGAKIILPPEKDKKEILSLCSSRQMDCQLTQ